LLALGHDPAAPLTTRHDGKPYDNFLPMPIGELAQWTITEGERGMERRRWRPFSSPHVRPPMREAAE
jgi:hypothetical protein